MINVEDLSGLSRFNRSNPHFNMVVQSVGDEQTADHHVVVIDFQEVPIYFM